MAQLDDAEIRARIKQARLEAGLSQTKMAELLGVIPRSVQNYENHHVPWGRVRDIAEVTGRSTRWLLHGEEGADPERSAELLAALGRLDTKLDRLLAQVEVSPEEEVDQLVQEIEEESAQEGDGARPGKGQRRSEGASRAKARRSEAARRAR